MHTPNTKKTVQMLAGCAFVAFAFASPAAAQDAPTTGDAPPPQASEAPNDQGQPNARRTFTPADFTRYAPKNAADMVQQIPGFQIRESEQLRGLGQATGNVLFNGQRASSKSDSLFTQLQRIPADTVQRIEIVDGATLDIPGLSGQVANVMFEVGGLSGQFAWRPEFRPHNTNPLFTRGTVSVSGGSGAIEYEVGLDNNNGSRGGADGPTRILNAAGAVTETRNDILASRYDAPKLSGKLTFNGAGGNIGHLNAHYQRIYDHYDEDGFRQSPSLPDRLRTVRQRNDTWNYELGGDYEFELGPGRLKAIGLRRFSHEPFAQTIVTDFVDGTTDIGDRFAQTGDLGEWIARGEYSWNMLGGDWQVAAEAAFNSLDNTSALFTLDPTGTFVEVPFPGGSGGVSEDRYEGSLSFGRSLTSKLSFQLNLAAEHSTIVQSGPNGLERSFLRPKGKLSLAWKPASDLDFAFSVQRRVLQLSFYDFLARAFLDDNNQNSGNNDLRPQQDWSFEGEVNKSLGAWGKTQLKFVYRDVQDYVDIIPVGTGGESVGNIDKAWAAAVVSTSTITFDPIGLKGVRLDGTVVLQTSRLTDPFTGERRQWSGFTNRQVNLDLRHDIPGSKLAWGAGANHFHPLERFRSNQTDRNWEGPWFMSLFVEHKDVFGLTVRARVGNAIGARQYRERVVFTGLRDASPVDFVELRDRRIGPIFTFTVRGNF